jgi:YebC/PmpR family DNA-binding regulatory protein
MSGHSKWATIRHKKGAADAKRGKVFSKISKELIVAAKAGGSNPDTNLALKTLIQKAKSVNMPSDNVERAIKKGAGEIEGATYEEIVYEGYASGGVGLVVKVLTDNKNRAAAEVRHIFTKHGSSLAGPGSVSRGFERRGQIFVDASAIEEDKLMEIVLDAGADDLSSDAGKFEILTAPSAFNGVMEALEKAGIKTEDSSISMVPLNLVPVTDQSQATSVMKFVADLEDNDDVQDVYTNMDISEEIAVKMESE